MAEISVGLPAAVVDAQDHEAGAAGREIVCRVDAQVTHLIGVTWEEDEWMFSCDQVINLRRYLRGGSKSWQANNPGFRIRIRINLSCWIRIQEGKNDPQK